MVVLYTGKEIQDVLKELRIKPVNGLVTTREAARLLSWRAEKEYEITHQYPESAVRRHVEQKNLKVAEQRSGSNFFRVEDVFEVPLQPKKGLKQKKLPTAA